MEKNFNKYCKAVDKSFKLMQNIAFCKIVLLNCDDVIGLSLIAAACWYCRKSSSFLTPPKRNFASLEPGHGMEWNGRRFFHIPYWQFSSISFPFHTKNLPFHTKIFFHIPLHTKEILDWKQCNVYIFCCFAPLQCCKQPLVKVRQKY